MATGIPGSNGGAKLSYRLEYEGKSSEQEVFSIPPASLGPLLACPGDPMNKILYGDNLPILAALLEDKGVVGKIELTYIDPPYATGSKFVSRRLQHAYEDLLSGASYLEFLRKRLILIRQLMSDTGSVYVHLDSNMAFPVKALMDEIFGERNFRNWITRKKCNPKNYTRKQFGNIADYILFYSKTDEYVWNPPFEPWTKEGAEREYAYVEEKTGRRFKKVPVHAPGTRNGATGTTWRGRKPPPGKHWQFTPEKLDEMDARGDIYWSPSGNPRRKIYLDESSGVPVQDIWLKYKDAHNQMIRITGYPTEKNAEMIRLIIRSSSNPGGLVLDAFAGSGTTAAVAEEEDRAWIAVDNSLLAIETMIQRLTQGSEPMGDFVRTNKPRTQTLFANRILTSGLEVLAADTFGLEGPSKAQLRKWKELLAP